MITIRNSSVRLIGYFALIANIIVFFITWLRWYIGIPAAAFLIVGYFMLRKNVLKDKSEFCITKKLIFTILAIIILWVLICGMGGAFPQKNDLHIRNAILHDLINFSWPVRYTDGFDSSLTYYIGFWIIPALAGKFAAMLGGADAGWITANVVYAGYCVLIISVVFLLIIKHLNITTKKRILLALVVLIFFSGMDIVPTVFRQLFQADISIGTHLEWWTSIQYSSNTTQLGWVYNQAVPAWLVTALLFHEEGLQNYAFLGLLLLPYGPIPFIGLFFIMIFLGFVELIKYIKKRQLFMFIKEVGSIQNIMAIITILPVYYLYYSTNSSTSSNGFRLNDVPFIVYYVFIIVEFLLYVILIMRNNRKNAFFIIGTIGLMVIPFFKLGFDQDFCMRASIPFLFILMVYVIEYLNSNIKSWNKGMIQISTGGSILLMFLFFGAATPLTEFRKGFVQIGNSEKFIADKYGTLNDGTLGRDNFITKHATNAPFYKYIGKSSN